MSKVHLADMVSNSKVPLWEENRMNGYRMTVCGYQRKETTIIKSKVTCKRCKKIMGVSE